jgi:hypothetical protein
MVDWQPWHSPRDQDLIAETMVGWKVLVEMAAPVRRIAWKKGGKLL